MGLMKKKAAMLKNDLAYGIVGQAGIYVLLIIVTMVSCKGFYGYGQQLVKYNYSREMPGVFDYYLNIFQGQLPFKPFSGMIYFMPVYWMTISIAIVYSVSSYAKDDFQKSGIMRIVYSGGRGAWIFGKEIWVLLQIAADYLMIWFAILFFAFLKGVPFRPKLSEEVWLNTYPDILYRDQETIIVVTIILPIMGYMAVAALEMLISIALRPVVAMALGCTIMVISSFFDKVWLLGNHAMWMRFSAFSSKGIDWLSALMLDIAILILSFSAFAAIVARKDLLQERES